MTDDQQSGGPEPEEKPVGPEGCSAGDREESVSGPRDGRVVDHGHRDRVPGGVGGRSSEPKNFFRVLGTDRARRTNSCLRGKKHESTSISQRVRLLFRAQHTRSELRGIDR